MPYKDPEKAKACKRDWNHKNKKYFETWHQEHPEFKKNQAVKRRKPRTLEQRRKYMIKSLYGLDWEIYQKMLAEQNNCCAICNKPETRKLADGRTQLLAVDHSHSEPQQVRELLCANCNVALGLFGDNLSILLSAAQYLQKWQKEQKQWAIQKETQKTQCQQHPTRNVRARMVVAILQ